MQLALAGDQFTSVILTRTDMPSLICTAEGVSLCDVDMILSSLLKG